jgi:hypothetical protein
MIWLGDIGGTFKHRIAELHTTIMKRLSKVEAADDPSDGADNPIHQFCFLSSLNIIYGRPGACGFRDHLCLVLGDERGR